VSFAAVTAPYVPTYASRESYVTVSDFLAAPTGTDTTQLIPGASVAANRAALAGVIQRASSMADNYCQQVLAATLDRQVAPPDGWRVQNRGGRAVIQVPVDYTPIVQITGVSLGWDPSSVTALTDSTGIWPGRKVVTIPVTGVINPPAGGVGSPLQSYGWSGRAFGWVDYVNGYANALLASPCAAGATSIVLSDVLGLAPGLPVTIYDGSATEQVQVSASYVPGSSPVTLAGPTVYAHTPDSNGITVSALPPAVRQAVISLTSSLVKRRGGESISMAAIHDEPSRTEMGEPGTTADEELAYMLLEPFRRVR